MNKEYIFTLKFKLPQNAGTTDVLVDELYAKGCDDALIGTGMPGQIALEFAREAETADAAITSALQDVLKVIPQAQLIEALPDYVGLSDIAELVSVSRQQMRKLYEQNVCFPAPLHAGKSNLWNLYTVLNWLQENKNYKFDVLVHEVAKVTAGINAQYRMLQASSKQTNNYNSSNAVSCYSVSVNIFFSECFGASFTAEMA